MNASELPEVIDVWYRSLQGVLGGLRPEQRHSEAESRSFFRHVVAARHQLWVAERGGRILGVLALADGEIDQLYVDTGQQQAGVGTALLERAKALCPAGLTLVTLQRNQVACRFYERHGFVAYRFGRSPEPEGEPDVWYRWAPGR